MTSSLYLRLVWRLLVFSNHCSKYCMEILSRHKVHSYPAGHIDGYGVSSVLNGTPKGEMNGVVQEAMLRNVVNVVNRNIDVPNLNRSILASSNHPACFQNNVVHGHSPKMLELMRNQGSQYWKKESSK